jgi:hypothetical protein
MGQMIPHVSSDPHGSATHALASAGTCVPRDHDIATPNAAPLTGQWGPHSIPAIASYRDQPSPHPHTRFITGTSCDHNSATRNFRGNAVSSMAVDEESATGHSITQAIDRSAIAPNHERIGRSIGPLHPE